MALGQLVESALRAIVRAVLLPNPLDITARSQVFCPGISDVRCQFDRNLLSILARPID